MAESSFFSWDNFNKAVSTVSTAYSNYTKTKTEADINRTNNTIAQLRNQTERARAEAELAKANSTFTNATQPPPTINVSSPVPGAATIIPQLTSTKNLSLMSIALLLGGLLVAKRLKVI